MMSQPDNNCHSAKHGRTETTITSKVELWVAQRSECDDLVRQWQSLEHKLSLKAKRLGVAFDDLLSKPGPERNAMQKLMQRISVYDRELPKSAQKILGLPTTGVADALSKIHLALHMKAPAPEDTVAWALVQQGYETITSCHTHPMHEIKQCADKTR